MSTYVNTDTRKWAQRVVDDFVYELHHSVTEPQIDFSRVPTKQLESLVDHIERVIRKAIV